jgi:hypothetical protein
VPDFTQGVHGIPLCVTIPGLNRGEGTHPPKKPTTLGPFQGHQMFPKWNITHEEADSPTKKNNIGVLVSAIFITSVLKPRN